MPPPMMTTSKSVDERLGRGVIESLSNRW